MNAEKTIIEAIQNRLQKDLAEEVYKNKYDDIQDEINDAEYGHRRFDCYKGKTFDEFKCLCAGYINCGKGHSYEAPRFASLVATEELKAANQKEADTLKKIILETIKEKFIITFSQQGYPITEQIAIMIKKI